MTNIVDIVDPLGQTWTVGSHGWYFWSGFLFALTCHVFGIIKRMAQRSSGAVDF